MTVASGACPARERAAVLPQDFDAFVDSRRDRAVRLAYRLLGGDAAAAEDVAQNAFARAWDGLARFRGEATLDTWFFRILVREAHRHRRWSRLRRLWSGSEAAPAPDVPDETPAGDPALRRRIVSALERLTAAQRETFVLVHLEGMTIAESALVLGKAPGTLKSHLHRALQSLRRDLGDLGAGEGKRP